MRRQIYGHSCGTTAEGRWVVKAKLLSCHFSLGRMANARNVRLYYPYRQYINHFIFRFLSCLMDISVLPETISVDSRFLFGFVRNRYAVFVYIINGNCKAENSFREIQNSRFPIYSDNGPQFASLEFQNYFAREWGFTHVTSSPRFAQSNEEAERAVQVAKTLLEKARQNGNDTIYQRNTPGDHVYGSPAELREVAEAVAGTLLSIY